MTDLELVKCLFRVNFCVDPRGQLYDNQTSIDITSSTGTTKTILYTDVVQTLGPTEPLVHLLDRIIESVGWTLIRKIDSSKMFPPSYFSSEKFKNLIDSTKYENNIIFMSSKSQKSFSYQYSALFEYNLTLHIMRQLKQTMDKIYTFGI